MATGYSVDLRSKVLNFISNGGRKREAAKIFNIGEDTVYRWIRIQNKQGNLKPKKRIFYPQKVNTDILQKYVEENPDHTLKEISTSLNLGLNTVWKWLRRLKITLKKRRFSTKNVTKKNVKNSQKKLKHSIPIKSSTSMNLV